MNDWLGRSEEQVRHEQRMALEHRRDKISSMRAEGFSESQIRAFERSERRNSCLGAIFLIALIIGGVMAYGAYQSSTRGANSPERSVEDEPQDEAMEEPTSIEPPRASGPENYQADSETELSATTPGTSVPEQQIIFVEKPVVQSIPSDHEEDAPAAPDDPAAADPSAN
jgi:hypothetical protein